MKKPQKLRPKQSLKLKSPSLQSPDLESEEDKRLAEQRVTTRNAIEQLIKLIPRNISSEDNRIACSVITGFCYGKTLKDCSKYYSLSKERSQYWWDFFNLSDEQPIDRPRRGSKTNSLESFVKDNIGKTFKTKDILQVCEITNPTLYNYINSIRGYFKKVGRGEYLLVDAQAEREAAK